ncbi:MAG: M16 family metallopeptidase [Angustibacter sp.]
MAAIPLPLTTGAHSTLTGADAGTDGTVVRRSVLPGGVRVLTEHVPGVRSVTLGCWVGVGSRDERPGYHGATHFLEHLVFKGTTRRSALDIAVAFDAVGGEANAVTGKEHTCYYARVLDEDVPHAADVITDMVTSSRLSREDVDAERGVILEELAMNDDDPSDVVHERIAEAVFGEHPLGRPIGGTAATINAIDVDHVVAHYREHYTAPGLVFTAAGSVDHDALCTLIQRELERAGIPLDAGRGPLPRRSGLAPGRTAEPNGAPPSRWAGTAGRAVVRRPTEQANVVLAVPSITATDERRYALSVLNAVLGGGMSSRLFQEIRERRGLAYAVYSFVSSYVDRGYLGLYAGCAPAKAVEVVSLLQDELDRIAEHGVSQEEVARGIGQVRGGLVLGMEDTGSRMTRLGRAELVYGEYLTLDEVLAGMEAVTREQVHELAAQLAAGPRSLAVVGPFDPDHPFDRVS